MLGKQFKNGLLYQNPVFVLLLGMCSTMAVSTSMQNAFGMGLSTTAVLICSNAVISALRKVIPDKIRIAAFIVIVAGFVTMVDLLLQAFLPSLSESLGIFIPLIVVNCIILGRAEAFAYKNSVLTSLIDGLSMGLGFTLALVCMSFVRELIGNGSLFGVKLLGENYPGVLLLLLPVGGFLMLGFIIAFVQWFISRKGGA